MSDRYNQRMGPYQGSRRQMMGPYQGPRRERQRMHTGMRDRMRNVGMGMRNMAMGRGYDGTGFGWGGKKNMTRRHRNTGGRRIKFKKNH